MKDNKPWYEKIYIWVAIIVGICSILGISVFDDISLFGNNKNNPETINSDNDDKTDKNSIQEISSAIDSQNSGTEQTTNDNNRLSEEELLIKQNWDFIQQSKEKYLEEDTIIIKNKYINLCFYEIGGYLYSNLKRNGNYDILKGNGVVPTKLYIIDYFSNKIVYIFSPKQLNSIWYSHGSQEKFYCVAFHDDYDIYISPPIQVGGEDSYEVLNIFFNKKDYEFTPLFQMNALLYDAKSDVPPLICSSDYKVLVYIRDKHSNGTHEIFDTQLIDLGILTYNNYSYFSLNKNYIMDLFLYHQSNKDLKISNRTFDGSVTNSNLVKIIFTINDENNIKNRTE